MSPPAVGTADGQHLTQPHAKSVEVHESGIRIEPLWSSQVAIPKQLEYPMNILLMEILRVKDVVNTNHCLNPKVKDDEDVI